MVLKADLGDRVPGQCDGPAREPREKNYPVVRNCQDTAGPGGQVGTGEISSQEADVVGHPEDLLTGKGIFGVFYRAPPEESGHALEA